MPQIAHFEIVKLSKSFRNRDGGCRTCEEIGPSLYSACYGYLEAGLNKHFQEEQDCITNFQSVEVSLREESMRTRWSCLVVALPTRAIRGRSSPHVRFLLSEDPVVTKHEVILCSKMEEWFKFFSRRRIWNPKGKIRACWSTLFCSLLPPAFRKNLDVRCSAAESSSTVSHQKTGETCSCRRHWSRRVFQHSFALLSCYCALEPFPCYEENRA